jgi:hypothetical protein
MSQTFTCINTLATLSQLFFFFIRPMKMELTVFWNVNTCSADNGESHKIKNTTFTTHQLFVKHTKTATCFGFIN